MMLIQQCFLVLLNYLIKERNISRGCRCITHEGALGDAEAIFAMHIDDTGTLSGPMLAAVCFFVARIHGQAAEPHNSVLAASSIVLALQQLISRELDPLQSQVDVKGGSALNVIPPYVELGGTLRSLTTEGLQAKGKTGQAVGKGSVDFKEEEEYPPYPATINDETLNNHVNQVGSMLLGQQGVKVAEKVMAGEDFAFYQQVIPGVMFGIGMRESVQFIPHIRLISFLMKILFLLEQHYTLLLYLNNHQPTFRA